MADPLGFYREQGLSVQLMKTRLGPDPATR